MQIRSFITPKRITILEQTNKKEALKEICNILSKDFTECDEEHLITSIFKRENLMSTGIGLGIAVPHVRTEKVSQLSLAVGISKTGIEYGSIDDQAVHIIFLIVSPAQSHQAYIKLLSQVVIMLKDDDFRQMLIDAENIDEIYELLQKQ